MSDLQENTDYEMIPGEGENWNIRILTGSFTETVIAFKQLRVTDDGEHLSFNFEVVSSPDSELDVETNTDLQKFAGMVLSNILENAAVRESNKN